jgi:site-specific DNA recombinase
VRSWLRPAIEIDRKIARQVRNLEREDDPDGAIYRRVQERLLVLEQELAGKLTELEALGTEAENVQIPELIDTLPSAVPEFSSFSEEDLGNLFEAFRLRVAFTV